MLRNTLISTVMCFSKIQISIVMDILFLVVFYISNVTFEIDNLEPLRLKRLYIWSRLIWVLLSDSCYGEI